MNVEPITVVVRVHRFDPLPDPASAAPSAAPSGAPSVIKDATRRDSEARRDRPGRPGRRHVSPFARLEKNHDADDASQTGTDGARKNTEENGTSGAAPARPRRAHTSPFAALDRKRAEEKSAHGDAASQKDAAHHAQADATPSRPRRAHTSPFAKLDRKRAEERAAGMASAPSAPSAPSAGVSHASAAPSTDDATDFPPIRRHRHQRRTVAPVSRRAASTLGGSPVAGSFGASATGRSWVQDYTVTVNPQTTVLDCLLDIKRRIDPTLAFRYSCGHGMCGSDAVSINGTPSLLCKTTVAQAAATARTTTGGFIRTGSAPSAKSASAPFAESTAPTDPPVIDLAPIPAFTVQRDLIVDMEPMLDQIRALQPYLEARDELLKTKDGTINVLEYLQSPAELRKIEQLSTCLACGVCESSCPVFVGGDAFIGPAAIVNQIRFIDDSRDGLTKERLEALGESDGLSACQSVRACGLNCPQGIDVGEVIWQFIQRTQTERQEG